MNFFTLAYFPSVTSSSWSQFTKKHCSLGRRKCRLGCDSQRQSERHGLAQKAASAQVTEAVVPEAEPVALLAATGLVLGAALQVPQAGAAPSGGRWGWELGY